MTTSMDDYCVICEHPKSGHFGSRCHRTSFLKGDCDCDFVERPPLPLDATAAQYRERAEWWRHRVRVTEIHIRRAKYGSERWARLGHVRDAAERSARRADEAAELKEAMERRERAAHTAVAARAAAAAGRTETEQQHLGFLEQIGIESIQGQPLCFLGLLQEQFDEASDDERQEVRARVEEEFNDLQPSLRRELLEDSSSRDFLEHIGVVSRWTVSFGQPHEARPTLDTTAGRPEPGSPEWADKMIRIARDPEIGAAFDQAMRESVAHMRFLEQLDAEYGDTAGDAYFAQTEAEEGRLPRDECFIADYEQSRSRIEAYWHNWSLAPSPQLQRGFMARDPEGFKRHMTMAIQVLTPPEKFRFTSHDELFGWIASGMRPLIVDGERVPLEEVVEARYLAQAGH
jgi:hypothetical protein